MAEIVGSLFGITPDLYERQLRAQDEDRAIRMANLAPGARGAAMIQSGAAGLTRGLGGLMGVEDPQMKLISARQQIIRQLDQTDPTSLLRGAKSLSDMGDQQGAFALADYARKAQESIALAQQRMREKAAADPFQKLVESGKYTPPSLAEYQRTGLLADLVLYEKPEKLEKPLAPNIKEIGVANQTREPVYLDVNNDQQFIYKKDAEGKQVRVPFTGGVDRTTSKTDVGVKLPEGESEFIKQLAKEDAQELSKARIASKSAGEELKSLQKLQQLNQQQLVSGSFATNRVGVLNFLNTLGMTSGKDAKTLANSEQYSKVTGDLLLDKIKKLGTQPSSTDREFIAKILPQLENSPAARQELINYLANRANEVVSEVRAMDTYARKNRGLGGYMPNIPLVGQTPDVSTMSTEQLQRIARGQKP